MISKPIVTTKRELILSAIEALNPADNPSTKWAMRRAIVWMARTARDDLRNDNLITRNGLKDELRGLISDIQGLQKTLQRPYILKGLSLAVEGNKFDEDENAIDRLGTKHLEKFADARDRIFSDFHTITIAAEATVYQLGLQGQKGSVSAWHHQIPSAKVKLAASGSLLYMAARGMKRQSGKNNTELANFLGLVWEAATGEQAQDWSSAIGTGRGHNLKKETIPAVRLAQNEAFHLLEKTEQWQAIHKSRSNRGFSPR